MGLEQLIFDTKSTTHQAIDASFILVFLYHELLEEIAEDNHHLTEPKSKVQLDQIVEVHPLLLTFTLTYLNVFLHQPNTNADEKKSALLIEGLRAGLLLTDLILLCRYGELKELLNCEGGDAFYHITGCLKEQIKELYETLKRATKRKALSVSEELLQSIMKKLCQRLESLALEDAWTEVLE